MSYIHNPILYRFLPDEEDFTSNSSLTDGDDTTVSGGVGGRIGAGVAALSFGPLSAAGGDPLQPLVNASA